MLKPILLVEDHPYDQELALFALKRSNLANEVVAVNDGAEALDYLFRRGTFASRPSGNPAVVLLDLKMPKVDGIEVLQEIRGNRETSRIPVVMLTGSKEERDIALSYDLGVNAFIVKPIEFKDLVQAVGDVGAFWTVLNNPPPGSVRYTPRAGDETNW